MDQNTTKSEKELKREARQARLKQLNAEFEKLAESPIFVENKAKCAIEGSFAFNPRVLDQNSKRKAGDILRHIAEIAKEAFYLSDSRLEFSRMYRFLAGRRIFSDLEDAIYRDLQEKEMRRIRLMP